MEKLKIIKLENISKIEYNVYFLHNKNANLKEKEYFEKYIEEIYEKTLDLNKI